MSLFGKSEPSPNFELSPQEAIFAVALAAAAADDEIVESEIHTIVTYLSRMSLYSTCSEDDLFIIMQKLKGHLQKVGTQGLVKAAKPNIPPDLVATAFVFAVDIMLADGVYTKEEQDFVDALRHILDISKNEANKIIEVMLIKNRG